MAADDSAARQHQERFTCDMISLTGCFLFLLSQVCSLLQGGTASPFSVIILIIMIGICQRTCCRTQSAAEEPLTSSNDDDDDDDDGDANFRATQILQRNYHSVSPGRHESGDRTSSSNYHRMHGPIPMVVAEPVCNDGDNNNDGVNSSSSASGSGSGSKMDRNRNRNATTHAAAVATMVNDRTSTTAAAPGTITSTWVPGESQTVQVAVVRGSNSIDDDDSNHNGGFNTIITTATADDIDDVEVGRKKSTREILTEASFAHAVTRAMLAVREEVGSRNAVVPLEATDAASLDGKYVMEILGADGNQFHATAYLQFRVASTNDGWFVSGEVSDSIRPKSMSVIKKGYLSRGGRMYWEEEESVVAMPTNGLDLATASSVGDDHQLRELVRCLFMLRYLWVDEGFAGEMVTCNDMNSRKVIRMRRD